MRVPRTGIRVDNYVVSIKIIVVSGEERLMAKKRRRRTLGELEARVMKVVWRRGRATVRDVLDDLPGRRKLAYTTVLTTLRNLEQKGFLGHEVEGRSHVYLPRVEEREVARSTLSEIADRLFDGSRVRLVDALLEEEQLTKKEFEALRQRILELRREEESDG